jgi:hypothetical protein
MFLPRLHPVFRALTVSAVTMIALAPLRTARASADTIAPKQDPAVMALVRSVGTNEYKALSARNADLAAGRGPRYFFFEEERSVHTGQHLWAQAVIETSAGQVERLLAIDGKPLDDAAQRAEDARIADLAAHPEKIKAAESNEMSDRKRSEAMFSTPPEMFLFSRSSAPDGVIAVNFVPNPDYVPQTYQQRVLHSLGGSIQADARAMRMSELDAKVLQRVEFGWGFLGYVQQGGTLHMARQEMPDGEWKMTDLEVHIVGRMLLFKSLEMEKHLVRRDFQLMPAQSSVNDDLKRLLAAKLPPK